jgi:hypothetical protein
MNASMGTMLDGMVDQMLAMQVGDILPEGSDADRKLEREAGGKSMREMMAAEDPHFEERIRISNRVMAREIVPIVTRLEPEVREALARTYALKYDLKELADIGHFFSTPAGRAFAADSLTVWTDPEIMAPMTKLVPELMKQMPAIIEKMAAATAHLPAPPAPGEKRKRR